jgi:DNA-binding IclR family transcriptional regulator
MSSLDPQSIPQEPTTARATPRTDYTIGAVVAALRVLVALQEPPHHLRVSDIARELKTSRNHAFRLVKTLEAEGFLFRRGDEYGIGMRLVQLVRSAAKEHEILRAAAQPLLDDLTRTSGESSYLSILTAEGRALSIAVAESAAHVRSVPVLGALSVVNAGAAAKLLFAYQPPERREQLLAEGLVHHTPYSKDGPGLLAELTQVASNHYAVALEEFHLGADSVAAPVWTAGGSVVAAVGLVGPSSRIRDYLPMPLAKRVLDVAREISAGLGGDPGEIPDVVLSPGPKIGGASESEPPRQPAHPEAD